MGHALLGSKLNAEDVMAVNHLARRYLVLACSAAFLLTSCDYCACDLSHGVVCSVMNSHTFHTLCQSYAV